MLTLYQFNACPFCWKVKALLNYAKQKYTVVEVTPFGMKELDFTDHKKVPVLRDGDKVITESSNIIDYINQHYTHFTVDENTKQWTKWVDKTLIHYLSPLIHPNIKTSYKNFAKIMAHNNFSWFKGKLIRLVGALMMPKVARKMKKKHHIKNTAQEYLQAIDYWVEKGLKQHNFYGGKKPNFVDCSVFGVLHAGDGLGCITLATSHNVTFARWYHNCKQQMSTTN